MDHVSCVTSVSRVCRVVIVRHKRRNCGGLTKILFYYRDFVSKEKMTELGRPYTKMEKRSRNRLGNFLVLDTKLILGCVTVRSGLRSYFPRDILTANGVSDVTPFFEQRRPSCKSITQILNSLKRAVLLFGRSLQEYQRLRCTTIIMEAAGTSCTLPIYHITQCNNAKTAILISA